jgi:hypothetical protein
MTSAHGRDCDQLVADAGLDRGGITHRDCWYGANDFSMVPIWDLEVLRRWANRYVGKTGLFAQSWPIGTTAIWIAVLLSGYVLIYYF